MGTRNLTCVVLNGEYKVAKYGQWDGYRSGLGTDILNFLRNEFDRNAFIAGVEKLTVISPAKLKELWNGCGADPKEDWVTMDVVEKFKVTHPELSRDTSGGALLKLIQDGTAVWSHPNLMFAADSLFCEWAYVLDLDKGTFEVYEGFNKSPLDASERFAALPVKQYSGGNKYYPVRLLKSYSLRRLPTPKTMCRVQSWSRKAEIAKEIIKKAHATLLT